MQDLKQQTKNSDQAAKKMPQQARSKRLCTIGGSLLICLAIIALVVMCQISPQSIASAPIPVNFIGEYSQNGGTWQPLTEDTRINALNGDLVLRGHFDYEREEAMIHAYFDNISMTLLVNGVEEYSVLNPDPMARTSTSTTWVSWTSKAFSGGTVEIRLSNSVAVGNPNAYQDFLNKLYVGPAEAFESYILSPAGYLANNVEFQGASSWAWFLQSGQFWRGIGFGVFVVTMILFAIALTDQLQSGLFGKKLWLMVALSLLSMGVIISDTTDVNLWKLAETFHTGSAQLCRMLWMLGLTLCVAELCSGRRRIAAYATAAVCGVLDGLAFLYCMIRQAYITDLLLPWFIVQAAVCLTLLVCCAVELRQKEKRNEQRLLAVLIVLLLAVAAELGNARFGFWQRGIVLHSIFVLLLLCCGIVAVRTVPNAYRAAKRASALEAELLQSRIAIMLSQIQPHFLYNALSTIRSLCRRDPDKAELATIEFTKFLRGNMDSLTADKPISFAQELAHTQNYLALELLRFPKKLNIVYDIQTEAFRLPTLTLQPIVENAVRYGVSKRVNGGTVTISTQETERAFTVTVSDDGVGCDMNQTHEDGRTHIGISNVQLRLAAMCGGTLSIASTPNVGTQATITIPKGDKLC